MEYSVKDWCYSEEDQKKLKEQEDLEKKLKIKRIERLRESIERLKDS